MENKIFLEFIGYAFGLYFFILQEKFFFYMTERFYCKKNKGNCDKCNCWSCKKYSLNYERTL